MQETTFAFEVLIGDDASADATAEIVERYARAYPRIVKLRRNPQNLGLMRNFNATLSRARGRYIALCEGDDYWTDPRKLQKQVDFLETHEGYSGCGHNARLLQENKYTRHFSTVPSGDLHLEAFLRQRPFHTASFLFRSKIVREHPLPDDILSGDRALFLLVASQGSVRYMDETMCVYRKHAGGVSNWVTGAMLEKDLVLPRWFRTVRGDFPSRRLKAYIHESIVRYPSGEALGMRLKHGWRYLCHSFSFFPENIPTLLPMLRHLASCARTERSGADLRRPRMARNEKTMPTSAPTVDIVLPVYNALEDVKKCLDSLYRRRTRDFRLVVIDDCSDDETRRHLEAEAAARGFTLVRNPENLRFTKSVNKALALCDADYVILLNSDTVVTERWIEKMLACFESDPRIGIVGPLSNAASWQTVPVRDDTENHCFLVNELPEGYDVDDMGLLVETLSFRRYPKVPSVNGFCYAISRSVIDAIGHLDEEAFPTGYGEEDDFSVRARDAGFEIAVADDVYIYHAKSKSYTHEIRKVLTKGGRKALDAKHGKERIDRLIADWKSEPGLHAIRATLTSYLHPASNNKKVVYTAIFGRYDSILEPEYVNPDWDYVCYTDDPGLTSETFTIKHVEPVFDHPTKNARMVKLLAHLFLIGYDHSLWIDSNVKLRGRNINLLLDIHREDCIALHRHSIRNCVYEEQEACSALSKDHPETMRRQVASYRQEGYPEQFGLVESAEILRNHKDPRTKRLDVSWWKELNRHSIRDQLSFNYACWKEGITFGIMEGEQWLDPYFHIYPHGIRRPLALSPQISVALVTNGEAPSVLETVVSGLREATDYDGLNLWLVGMEEVEAARIKARQFQPPSGGASLSETLNALATYTNDPYLCIIHTDAVVIEHNWLQLLVEELNENAYAAAVGPVILGEDYHIRSAAIHVQVDEGRLDAIINNTRLNTIGFAFALDAACIVVNRERFIEVGGFRPDLSLSIAVIDFCFRLRERNYSTHVIGESHLRVTSPRNRIFELDPGYPELLQRWRDASLWGRKQQLNTLPRNLPLDGPIILYGFGALGEMIYHAYNSVHPVSAIIDQKKHGASVNGMRITCLDDLEIYTPDTTFVVTIINRTQVREVVETLQARFKNPSIFIVKDNINLNNIIL